jgi:OOP family OmpA-OmpF porin
VYNGIDRCPGTPRGQQIDEVGCAVLFRIERGKTQPLILRGVNFETGRSRLTAESYAMLDRVAESLVAHPDVRIEVAGHTDSTGSHALNMRLSRERALAVMAYLAQRGVAPSRMTARGYGPDSPIGSNRTAAGRADNRRVELLKADDGGR